MNPVSISEILGAGAQLFRVRSPKKHFIEVTALGPLKELCLGERRVWKLKHEDVWFALLTIPYKDEEDILVRAPDGRWEAWDWRELAERAESCRWPGLDVEPRHVL